MHMLFGDVFQECAEKKGGLRCNADADAIRSPGQTTYGVLEWLVMRLLRLIGLSLGAGSEALNGSASSLSLPGRPAKGLEPEIEHGLCMIIHFASDVSCHGLTVS